MKVAPVRAGHKLLCSYGTPEIKDATAKINIHSLLNILKAYYAKTHQDKPSPTNTDGTVRLQLVVHTRQALGT
jgi:hypothetical protein